MLFVAGVYLAPGSHGGGISSFDPVQCPPKNEPHRTIKPRLRAVSCRGFIAFRSSLSRLIYRSWMLLFFSFSFLSVDDSFLSFSLCISKRRDGETESVPEEIESENVAHSGHVGEENSLRAVASHQGFAIVREKSIARSRIYPLLPSSRRRHPATPNMASLGISIRDVYGRLILPGENSTKLPKDSYQCNLLTICSSV